MSLQLRKVLRPGEEVLARNVWTNIRRNLPQVWPHAKQGTRVCLCGGGPTLKDYIEKIRKKQLDGAEVVCVGNAAAEVAAHGIKVNGHVIMDGAKRNKSFVVPIRDCRYFVASQCDPGVFRALENHRYVYIWHTCSTQEDFKTLNAYYGKGNWFPVDGGSYVTLRAIALLNTLGYRNIEVFGLDSCLKEDEHHAYHQPMADGQPVIEVKVGRRKFRCNPWMLDQAEQFMKCLKMRKFGDAHLSVYGGGMIASILEEGSVNGRNS